MDLKTFVEETLCQLAEGVEAAQKRLAPLGVSVNPYFTTSNGKLIPTSAPHAMVKTTPNFQTVDFDVAITAAEKDASGGGFSLAVVMAKLGAGVHNESSSSTVSRVKFQVVIDLPHHKSAQP